MASRESSLLWSLETGLEIALQAMQEKKALSRDDGGALWVFSSCGTIVGFLTRYDGDLREPLVWRQGSQVSMWVQRGSASFLLSHGRKIGPQDVLKTDCRGLFWGVAGIHRRTVHWPGVQSRVLSPNSTGGLTLFRPLKGLQEISVAIREESGVHCFPSR